MRSLLLTLALGAASMAVAGPAWTQSTPTTIGVIGNNVEMYMSNNCTNDFQCFQSFPVNNTGKVIRINYVSCEIFTSAGDILFARFGPAAIPKGSMIKTSFFGSRHVAANGTSRISYVTATPDMFLGAGRYLTVGTETIGSGATTISCQAAGVFAQ